MDSLKSTEEHSCEEEENGWETLPDAIFLVLQVLAPNNNHGSISPAISCSRFITLAQRPHFGQSPPGIILCGSQTKPLPFHYLPDPFSVRAA